jgi:hypothetical protein
LIRRTQPPVRRVRGMNLGNLGITTSTEIGTSLNATAGIVAVAVPIIGPIIGAGIAAVSAMIQAFGIGNGCGSTCSATTQVVNQIIPMMQTNLAAANAQAQANGGCLYPAEQQAAAGNFTGLWNTIVQQCTQIGGTGGKSCIADRQRGGKYDCFSQLLDPINAIPVCQPAATTAPAAVMPAGVVSATPTAATSSVIAGVPDTWLYLAAAGIVAFIVIRK